MESPLFILFTMSISKSLNPAFRHSSASVLDNVGTVGVDGIPGNDGGVITTVLITDTKYSANLPLSDKIKSISLYVSNGLSDFKSNDSQVSTDVKILFALIVVSSFTDEIFSDSNLEVAMNVVHLEDKLENLLRIEAL
jgi:hypothetical protein